MNTINASDKDIKTWDRRLGEQVGQAWENYKHVRIDLTTARVDQPLLIAAEFIYVEERSGVLAVAKIKLNRNTNDALDLEKGVEIYTVFKEVYISNDALQGEWLDLVFGINFAYKKKIVDLVDGPFMFTTGGPLITPAGVNLQLLPGAGGITQIGDAGATSDGLVANDDLYVSGKLEVDNQAFFSSTTTIYGPVYERGLNGSCLYNFYIAEVLTIPIGQGAAGVVTAANLAPINSTIISCSCRVTQAPGGGATTIDIGRTGGGNLDEFIDGIGTALGTTGTFAANHDAATLGPILNGPAQTLTLTTDANVTIADMKVRIIVFYRQETPPTS